MATSTTTKDSRHTMPAGEDIYVERLSSTRTELLFAGLTLVGLLAFYGRIRGRGFGRWATVFLSVFVMFLFYTLNYRTLEIRVDADSLRLRFGLFKWVVALDNIESCYPDGTSLQRIGGAGIHFTSLGGRYRAMFNFLEYPRLVVALKERQGPVREIAFSTKHPDELMRLVLGSVAARHPA